MTASRNTILITSETLADFDSPIPVNFFPLKLLKNNLLAKSWQILNLDFWSPSIISYTLSQKIFNSRTLVYFITPLLKFINLFPSTTTPLILTFPRGVLFNVIRTTIITSGAITDFISRRLLDFSSKTIFPKLQKPSITGTALENVVSWLLIHFFSIIHTLQKQLTGTLLNILFNQSINLIILMLTFNQLRTQPFHLLEQWKVLIII